MLILLLLMLFKSTENYVSFLLFKTNHTHFSWQVHVGVCVCVYNLYIPWNHVIHDVHSMYMHMCAYKRFLWKEDGQTFISEQKNGKTMDNIFNFQKICFSWAFWSHFYTLWYQTLRIYVCKHTYVFPCQLVSVHMIKNMYVSKSAYAHYNTVFYSTCMHVFICVCVHMIEPTQVFVD